MKTELGHLCQINKMNQDLLPYFILPYFSRQVTKENAFINICKQLEYPDQPLTRIFEWFLKAKDIKKLKDIEDYYLELIDAIDRVFDDPVPYILDMEFGDGNRGTRLSAFKKVYHTFNQPSISDEEILEWFRNYQSNDNKNLREDIGTANFNLIQQIEHEFLKRKTLIHKFEKKDSCPSKFMLSDSRYGFNGTHLIDYYHGKKRKITVSSKKSNPKNSASHFLINETFLLYIEHTHLPDIKFRTSFKLFKLSNGTYQFLTEHNRQILLKNYFILLDGNDRFGILAFTDSGITLILGDLSNEAFIEEQNILDREVEVDNQVGSTFCYRLIDGKLSALKLNIPIANSQMVYWNSKSRINLQYIYGQGAFFNYETCGLQEDFYVYFNSPVYAWKDSVCYVNMRNNQTNSNDVFSFDIENRECVLVNIFNGFDFRTLKFKDENYLIGTTAKEVYKFKLNEPEKLQNIVWFDVKKNRNTKLYGYALKIIPPYSELQPFYVS